MVHMATIVTIIQSHACGNRTRAQNSSACNPCPNITNLPNMPIDQNTGKRQQATETERITVIEKHAEGKNYGQIARETAVSKSETQRIVKRWETTKIINPPPRPGFKPKLDERARRRLHGINEQNPHAPLGDITADLNLNVSERTVGETLRCMNFYVHVARKKPFLNYERKWERLRWARERRNWNNFVWRKKIFVDKMKLTIGQGGGKSMVRRPPGTALEDRYLEPLFPDNKTTVMFTAGFTYGFHTQLIPIRQRTQRESESGRDRQGMNSVQYCQEIYTPHFLP